ncbi:RNA polymerase sigma factor [Catenulispora yoronensis]
MLVLRYYEDLSDQEIAGVMGCSPATVRSQASRGWRRCAGTCAASRPWAAWERTEDHGRTRRPAQRHLRGTGPGDGRGRRDGSRRTGRRRTARTHPAHGEAAAADGGGDGRGAGRRGQYGAGVRPPRAEQARTSRGGADAEP